MNLLKFSRGGVSPLHSEHEGKTLTEKKPVVELPAGKTVSIPMAQNLGAPCRPVVTVGQEVGVGEVIGEPLGFVGAPVHASVSGKVIAVRDLLHVNGKLLPHVIIENDGEYRVNSALKAHTWEEVAALSPEALRKIVLDAGIVGAGGATFPTHVKLSIPADKKVDMLVINGAECEPFLTADYRLMLEQSQDVIDGIRLLMQILSPDKALIGIEDNKPKAIEAMQQAGKGVPGVQVCVMRTKYPQGSEKQLIEACTGRQVPSGKLPADAGCVVVNVGTCAAVADAVLRGMPMVSRITTVTGAVREPKNVRVRIGTSFSEAIDFCGGYEGDVKKLISGGPMMGVTQFDDGVHIVKGTSGILVLNAGYANYPDESSCLHCGKCVYACPMGLMPLKIDLWSRKKNWEMAEDYLAMNCIECGSCSYVCPSKRHIVQGIRLAKAEIGRIRREKAAKQKEGGK